jgi:hypothetical protein
LKSKTDVTEVNFAEHVAETAKRDKQVTRRSPNDDIVEMEQGGGSHEIVPTRKDAEEVNKDEKAEDDVTAGEKQEVMRTALQGKLPLSLSRRSKHCFDKKNPLTESEEQEHLGSRPVLVDLCKFSTNCFSFQISSSNNRATTQSKRHTYWLQNVSNPDFVRGYERFNLVVSALLQHVAAMQVCGAELEALCKEDQELQALLQRCEQLKGHRALVTSKSKFKSDGCCFWLQACNDASDIKYFEDRKSLQEAVEHLPPQPQQHKTTHLPDKLAVSRKQQPDPECEKTDVKQKKWKSKGMPALSALQQDVSTSDLSSSLVMTGKRSSTPADFLTYDNPGNPTASKDVAKGSETAKTSPGQHAGGRGVAGEVAALDVAPKRAGQNAVVDASEELSGRRDWQQPDRYEAAPASRVIKAAQTPPAVAQAAGSVQRDVHARQNEGENEHCASSNAAQHDTQEEADASRADGQANGSGYGRSGRGNAGLQTAQATSQKEEDDTIVEDNVDETRAMPSAQKGAPKHDGDLRHGGIRGSVDVEEQSAGDEEAVNRRKSTRGSGDGAGGGLGGKVIVSPPAKGPQRRSTGSTTGTADDVDKNACESQAECTRATPTVAGGSF